MLDLTAGREVLSPGATSDLLQLHPDLPNSWDAWDVDRHYRNRSVDLTDLDSLEVVDEGPLLARVRVVRSVGASRIEQVLELEAGSRRLDIVTHVDWHERERMLEAAFPIDVHADREASEIQFGHVFRPTHTNTSWEAARSEVPAHRWVHVGEPGYGAALITDSRYGHDSGRRTDAPGRTGTTVRLSLLRGPCFPDPGADLGEHRSTYSLLVGAGSSDAVEHGYRLNLPLRVVAGGGGSVPAPLVSVTGSGAVVEAVKLADDRSGDLVVRLYEAHGARTTAVVSAGTAVAGAQLCDLLEDPATELTGREETSVELAADGTVSLPLRPFQVVTLRLRRAA